MEKYYKYFGERFLPSGIGAEREKEIKIIKSFLPQDRVKDILDLGCGGVIPILLSKEGYNVIGIDLNQQFIQKGKKYAKEIGTKVTLIHGDVRNLERCLRKDQEHSFDALLMWDDVLPHLSLQDFDSILKTVRKYMRKKWYFLVSYVDAYKMMIETGYKPDVVTQVTDRTKSISSHKGYDEKNGAFIRHHIIKEGEKVVDEFDLKVHIYAPSLVEFVAKNNGCKLEKRKIIKFPFHSYESVVDLYKSD
jgi:SAM-dependent methyltransferase